MDSAATTLRAVIVVTLILGGASAARAQPIFATGFEPSDATWATSIGFVFFAESFDTGTSSLATGSTSATVVWHRSTVESASAPDSLQVSNPLTGTYQDDSLRVSATATTPLLSLPPEGAVLSFALLKDTEGDPSHDELFVDALDSSAGVLQTWTFGFEYPAFTTFRRLLPYAAGGVRVRFRFDTIDASNNGFAGAFLDDVRIEQVPPCAQGRGASAAYQDRSSGHCYLRFDGATSYDGAETACVALGGTLAAITTAGESVDLTSLLDAGSSYWIGANCKAPHDVWSFVWETGEPFSYTNWDAGEPNNYPYFAGGPGAPHAQDCVHVYGASGTWDDLDCAAGLPYFCELP